MGRRLPAGGGGRAGPVHRALRPDVSDGGARLQAEPGAGVCRGGGVPRVRGDRDGGVRGGDGVRLGRRRADVPGEKPRIAGGQPARPDRGLDLVLERPVVQAGAEGGVPRQSGPGGARGGVPASPAGHGPRRGPGAGGGAPEGRGVPHGEGVRPVGLRVDREVERAAGAPDGPHLHLPEKGIPGLREGLGAGRGAGDLPAQGDDSGGPGRRVPGVPEGPGGVHPETPGGAVAGQSAGAGGGRPLDRLRDRHDRVPDPEDPRGGDAL